MTTTKATHKTKRPVKTTQQHQSSTPSQWTEILDFQQQAQEKKSRLAQLAQQWQSYLNQLENSALKNILKTKVNSLIQADISLPAPPSDRLLIELNLAFSAGTLNTYSQYTKIIAKEIALEHYPIFYDKQQVFPHIIVSHHLQKALSLDTRKQQTDLVETTIEDFDLATLKNQITHLETLFTVHFTTVGKFQTFINNNYGFQRYQNLLEQVPLLVQNLQVLLLKLTQQKRVLQQLQKHLGNDLHPIIIEEISEAICPTSESKAQLLQHRQLLLQLIENRLSNNITNSDQIMSMQQQLHACVADYIRFKTKTAQVTTIDHKKHSTSLFTQAAISAATTISEPLESLLDKFDAAVQKYNNKSDLMSDSNNSHSQSDQDLFPKMAKRNRYLTSLV